MLQLKNIYKSYITGTSKQIALDGINLKFRESEFVSILGPSGSGKTTLLNIIGGLEQYDKGDLIINGKSTKDFTSSNWDSYRNNIVGFIFKNNNLIPHLSILENVMMAISFNGLSKNEKQYRAIQALNKVGIKDYMRKTSEYLTKNEIQRVAIAKVFVKNPMIILADEPTGNLDSKSSLEIMDLIKEVFKDKLVLMITQNKSLAKAYSNRIIMLRDGEVIEDTNPLREDLKRMDICIKKTNMNIFMAIKLAFRDILNKKLRMFFYILISSIGIMGIALIISLIEGFGTQIKNYENKTLTNYPIVINKIYKDSENLSDTKNKINQKLNEKNTSLSYKNKNFVYSYDSNEDTKQHINKIKKDYINYIKKIDKSLISSLSYESQININILKKDLKNNISVVDTSYVNLSSYPQSYKNKDYLKTNYDLLYGYYPTNKNEIVLIVDEYNRLDNDTLKALGIEANEGTKIEFDELIGKEYKIILNDNFYKNQGGYFYTDNSQKALNELYNSKDAIKISITAILKPKENNDLSELQQGISFSNELINYYINNCDNSQIVTAQKNSSYNVITGQSFKENKYEQGDIYKISGLNVLNNINQSTSKEQMLSSLGAYLIPSSIKIYPKDFESKNKIIKYLDRYNEDKDEDEKILYTDSSNTINNLSTNIIKGITIALIVFVSIVFLITLITIFILTYASILERKIEISVLRVLGAKKRDILRLFNAENIIIGLLSGILGVFMAYIFIIPINYMFTKCTNLSNVAILKVNYAILIVIISVIITVIGGFIPAKIAAKKDVVQFLKK